MGFNSGLKGLRVSVLLPKRKVFTAQYGMSPYITQIGFVVTWLKKFKEDSYTVL